MFQAYWDDAEKLQTSSWRTVVAVTLALQALGRQLRRLEVDHGNAAPTPIHQTIVNHCMHRTMQMPRGEERYTHVFELTNGSKLFLDSDGGIELRDTYGLSFFRRQIPFEPHEPIGVDCVPAVRSIEHTEAQPATSPAANS